MFFYYHECYGHLSEVMFYRKTETPNRFNQPMISFFLSVQLEVLGSVFMLKCIFVYDNVM